MQTKTLPLALPLGLLVLGAAACSDDAQQPAQYPQQQYPQYQQYPTATTTATTATTVPTSATTTQAQTATAIPGVMKNADGTCSVTLPSLNGQPSAPLVGACPPGL